MTCQHRGAIILDSREDQLVCTMCGLVLEDRPSLSPDLHPAAGPVVQIPVKTRALLVQMAKRLRAPESHLMRAATVAMHAGATCRHPASLAACFVVTGTGTLKEAERVLGIPHRQMSRAVSRLRRQRKLKSCPVVQ